MTAGARASAASKKLPIAKIVKKPAVKSSAVPSPKRRARVRDRLAKSRFASDNV